MTGEPVIYLPDGRPIVRGLNPDVPEAIYHGLPGVSQSMLKVIRDKSPAHLKWQIDNPPDETDATRATLRLGAAVHDCVLLPELFRTAWTLPGRCEGMTQKGDQCTRRGTLRQLGQWFCAQHPLADLEPDPVAILSEAELEVCTQIREAIGRHPRARALLDGDAEQSALWDDHLTGVLCRGRFDLIGRRSGALTDLKTCRSAAPLDFERAIWQFGYHIQGAHYLDGAHTIGLDVDRFAFVAVEKEPPWAVAIYELSSAALLDGGRERDPLLATYAACLATGEWPGYPQTVEMIDLPSWAPYQIDTRLGAHNP